MRFFNDQRLKFSLLWHGRGRIPDACVPALIRVRRQRRVISLEPSEHITGGGVVGEQEMTASLKLPNYKAAETFEMNAPSAVQKGDRCSSAEAVSASRQMEST